MRRPHLDYRFIPIYLAAAIGPFSGNIILPMIPILKNDLFTDVSLIMLSLTLFQIPFALGQFFSGGLSDVYGRMKLILAGFLLLALGFAFTPFSTDIWFFIVTRIVQGLGLALISPVLIALIGDLTEPSKRGRYMGFYSAAIQAGIAIGPFIGGVMANQWRLLFMIMAVFSVILTVCSWLCLRRIAVREGGSLGDIAQNLRDTLRYRQVLILGAIGFLVFFSYLAVISLTSDALSVFPYYIDPNAIGIILSTSGVLGIFTSSLAGFLTDRFGKLKIPTVGMIIAGASLIIMALVTTLSDSAFPLAYIPNLLESTNQSTNLTGQAFASLLALQILFRSMFGGIFWDFLVLMSIRGIGISFVWPALLALSVEVVPPQMKGASTSIFSGMRFLGYSMAPVAFTPVYLWMGLDAVFIIGAALTPPIMALIYLVTKNKIEKPEWLPKKEESKPGLQKRKQKSHNKNLGHKR
ncbi:MAG: MFS transporter [Candidatus Jordarchaeum sp.]|uniref:MFS transporter n=1 Tax=Candidatus Jordarchaeum sp. TaxID=2823881 RepID=UPI00404AA987